MYIVNTLFDSMKCSLENEELSIDIKILLCWLHTFDSHVHVVLCYYLFEIL